MPKRILNPDDRVIRFSVGVPQRILNSLDEVLNEYNRLLESEGHKPLTRSQYISMSLEEAYSSPATVEYLKARIGIAQIELDLSQKQAKATNSKST